jgi:hypothetical protein
MRVANLTEEFDFTLVSVSWFLCLFVGKLQQSLVMRFLDHFFLTGPLALFHW